MASIGDEAQALQARLIALVDIDKKRVELAQKAIEMIVKASGKNWRVQATTDRRSVLEGGAD